jgi:CubicO group peptidase (beta-lactamase class C family)
MTDRSLVEKFEDILRDLIGRGNVRQAITAVRSSDAAIDWVGTAVDPSLGIEEPGPETPFFLASIDKLLNATIVMMLSEKGVIDIDERIVDLLPSDVIRGLHVLDGIDSTSEITVRHMLTHASGLPDWLEESPRGGNSLVENVLEEGDRALSFEEVVRIVSDDLRPYFPPQDLSGGRAKIRYSDTNFILLIWIIERVTGQPLHRCTESCCTNRWACGTHTSQGAVSPSNRRQPPCRCWPMGNRWRFPS